MVLAASLGLSGAAVASAQDAAEAAKFPSNAAQDGKKLSYVVNTEADPATFARVKKEISKADGTVVTAYKRIGVLVAHSANPGFGDQLRAVPGVDSAGATRTAPLKAANTTDVGKPQYMSAATAKAAKAAGTPGEEPLESLQWDKRAIKADEAGKVSQGSKDVTVGVIDTGVDDTHPDLKANFAARQSASCVGGKADTSPGAWRPFNPAEDYHGTHVAGIVAAPRNGVGIAGTAPGVKVASLKVSEADTSLFFTEAVVCAMMFAADHGIEVTNNSYYIDPWLYNCRSDKDQGALVDAVTRAVKYATGKGTAHVASAGNSSHDLASHSIVDDSSPDDSTPVVRTVDPSACPDIPSMLPGVTNVAATGPANNLKSFYSNYGAGQIDVAAPGGDSRYQAPPPPAKSGGVLSTMPDGEYAYLQGTSMAGPQVAGVAALIKSKHPDVTPQELAWRLKAHAQDVACPAKYDPDGKGTYAATCTGSPGSNNFYGSGLVNALAAVTK
jgi:subtilisin family serine protease